MKYIFPILMLMSVMAAKAQDSALLGKFVDGIKSSCVAIEYSYTARVSGVDNIGSGNLMSQGQMWTMFGNGIEMYCDGKTVWVVDPVSKEVIIEPISDEEETEFLTNPARMVLNITDSFDLNTVRPSSDSRAHMFSLVPKSKSDIEYLNIELLNESALIRNMSFALNDGTLVTIKVNSMKLTPKVSDKDFVPQTVFDSKWIVTDLR